MRLTINRTSMAPAASTLADRPTQPLLVQAAAVSRAVSSLTQNAEFALGKGEKTQGFMYFFNNQTKAAKSFWTFTSLFASVFMPETFPFTGTNKTSHKKYAKIGQQGIMKNWTEMGLSNLINVRKNDSDRTFDIQVPLFAIDESQIRFLMLYLGAPDDQTELQFPRFADLGLKPTPITSQLKPRGNLVLREVAEMEKAKAVLVPRTIGSRVVFMLRYTATEKEVKFLTNEKFELIKPMDVYGPIYEWVGSYYGQYGKSPSFSIPIRQIARGVAKSDNEFPSTPRLGIDDLMIDEHATIHWMPREINEVSRFEDTYSDAFTHESGVFGLVDTLTEGVDVNSTRKKPPVPMPVFVDWLNMKFAYTNAEGRLNVLNLDRTYAVNELHIHRWLDRRLTSDRGMNFVAQAINLMQFFQVPFQSDIRRFTDAIYKYAKNAEGSQPEDIKLSDIQIYATETFGDPLIEAVAFIDGCRQTLKKIEESPETSYARYSVMTIMELRGGMTVMANHTADSVSGAVDAKLKPYRTQGFDPNYKLQPVPFIGGHMGFLPHQNKVLNMTRDMPDNILYPIEAGGGKTPTAIFELLREMKAGNKGPFLVMCPSHLVAQYVKEVVYVTEGRLNVVPITTYTIRRQGLERLKAVIEAAPVNTVILTDYNAITLKQQSLAYGTTSVRVFPIIEFIRQFAPSVWFSDETHFLKSESNRQSAVHRLIADIPKKRGMSGTFVADTIKDLVKQAALFDPSIFGTVDDFIKEFALEVKGSKVLQWKPNTELAVKNIMKENFVMAEAKRKEWAAILPKPVERFHPVEMTSAQYTVYNQILQQVVDQIRAEIEKNQTLRDLMSGSKEGEDGEEVDEEAMVSIDQLLKPYLARLERFITAPGKDLLGAEVLKGEDLISPKALKIAELASNHVRDGIAGKVLIFTNYTLSAEAIYEAFDEDMRSQVVYYTVDRKEECLAAFEKNDEKKILVGVEQSLNTGGNLQHASRLIRTETVWTPGVLEQGNARIGRPNIKNRETRSEIYYDWVISNKTIDVTKISYLMAKTISRAKYEEAGNPRFDDLEVPALFSMTLDTVLESNDFQETMVGYFDKYEAYKQAMFAEYADYREKNKTNLFDENGKIRMVKAERSENVAGSKLIVRVPYVPGTELYKAADLGLVRYDEYMRLIEDEEDEGEDADSEAEEDENDEATDEAAAAALKEERERAVGLAVHTDRGDGEIVAVGKRNIRVELTSGEKISLRKMAAFIITRADTTNKDIRTQLLKAMGDVPLDAPVESLESQMTARKQRLLEKEQQKQNRLSDKEQRQQEREQRKLQKQQPAVQEDDAADFDFKVRVGYKKNRKTKEEEKVYTVVNPAGDILFWDAERAEAVKWMRAERKRLKEEAPAEEPEADKYSIKVGYVEGDNGDEVKVFNVVYPDGEIAETFSRRRDAAAWIEDALNANNEPEKPSSDSGIPLNLEFTIVNDILGIRLTNVDNQDAVDLAQTYGFKFSPAYYAVEVKTADQLLDLFNKWKKAGFNVPKDNSTLCAELYRRLKTGGRKNAPNVYGFATSMDLKNFYREEFKPNPKTDTLLPYPIIQDGLIYVALPARGHPASKLGAQKGKVPGSAWMMFDQGQELIAFTPNKGAASTVIRKMVDNNVNIENIDELRKHFKALKMGKQD